MAFNILDAIKNREKAVSAQKAESGRLKIEYISVKDIVPAAGKRNYYSTEDIEALKTSIAVHGVKQNLLVKAIAGGKYELIAGERRWRASSALFADGRQDREFVPCVAEMPKDDLDERLLLTTTNSTARELSDYEKSLQVKEMHDILDEYERRGATIEGDRRKLIMQHLGMSSGQVGRYTAIHNNLSEVFTKEYAKKEIAVSVAYELSRLPESEQAAAYCLYMEQGGLSIKDVRTMQEKREDLAGLEERGQGKLEELTDAVDDAIYADTPLLAQCKSEERAAAIADETEQEDIAAKNVSTDDDFERLPKDEIRETKRTCNGQELRLVGIRHVYDLLKRAAATLSLTEPIAQESAAKLLWDLLKIVNKQMEAEKNE